METNKILLVIVEGRTDENALGPALTKIIPPTIKFKVIKFDITSDYDSTVRNIEDRIKRLAVKRFLEKNVQFNASDICKIVHLVDTDGVFVPDSNIVKNDSIDKVIYYKDHIEVNSKNYDELILSRENKRNILKHLVSISNIRIPFGYIVPYEIYYMSNNLDSIIGNNMNAEIEEKIDISIDFGDEYDDPEKFINYFNNPELIAPGEYYDSWDFISKDLNSLNRYSNFHLFLNKIQESI